MVNLDAIHQNTMRMIEDLKWSQQEIDDFVNTVNGMFERQMGKVNDSVDTSLVVHDAKYSGGFILVGGWTQIYDATIQSGTRGHELYLKFGGLGAGGWKGKCDIELITDGTVIHDGKYYSKPKAEYCYDQGEDKAWETAQTGFNWFHDHVKSFMFMYLPQFIQAFPIFVYFDGSSNRIGVSIPSASISCGIGGGTVKVEK